jgi:hypothetical protein
MNQTDEAVVAARTKLASLKPSPDTTAFEAGKEVMEKLRSLHMVLGSTMESMLQVGTRSVDCLFACVQQTGSLNARGVSQVAGILGLGRHPIWTRLIYSAHSNRNCCCCCTAGGGQ